MKYLVNWNYRSSIGGPWLKGQSVEVDDALAVAVNNDSPGVLTAEVEVQARVIEAPPADRMVKAPAAKRKSKG